MLGHAFKRFRLQLGTERAKVLACLSDSRRAIIGTARKDMTMEYILLFLVGIAIGGPLLWWASKQP